MTDGWEISTQHPALNGHIVGRCEKYEKNTKQGNNKKLRRKKSEILYFDIFYVDLDSTQNSTGAFLEQFLMNMSLTLSLHNLL